MNTPQRQRTNVIMIPKTTIAIIYPSIKSYKKHKRRIYAVNTGYQDEYAVIPQSVVNTPQTQRTNVIIIPKITIAMIYPPIYFIDFICSYYNILLAL